MNKFLIRYHNICGDIMDQKERKEKQLELAKLFYEMGMEEDVILKISGIEKDEYLNIQNKPVDKEQ